MLRSLCNKPTRRVNKETVKVLRIRVRGFYLWPVFLPYEGIVIAGGVGSKTI